MREPHPIRRVRRPRQAAAASYDRLSRWYDLLARAEAPFRQLGFNLLQVGPGDRALEIGAGTGATLVPLCRAAGPDGVVVGLDLSGGMLQRARARLQRSGLRPRACGLCRADAIWLPFRRHGLDAVLMTFVLELFDTPDIGRVLDEVRRVLHGRGRLVVVALSRRQVTPSVWLYEWAHDRAPAWLDCRPIYVEATLRSAGWTVHQRREGRLWGLPVTAVLARPDG